MYVVQARTRIHAGAHSQHHGATAAVAPRTHRLVPYPTVYMRTSRAHRTWLDRTRLSHLAAPLLLLIDVARRLPTGVSGNKEATPLLVVRS